MVATGWGRGTRECRSRVGILDVGRRRALAQRGARGARRSGGFPVGFVVPGSGRRGAPISHSRAASCAGGQRLRRGWRRLGLAGLALLVAAAATLSPLPAPLALATRLGY